jgi:hypothetical protein
MSQLLQNSLHAKLEAGLQISGRGRNRGWWEVLDQGLVSLGIQTGYRLHFIGFGHEFSRSVYVPEPKAIQYIYRLRKEVLGIQHLGQIEITLAGWLAQLGIPLPEFLQGIMLGVHVHELNTKQSVQQLGVSRMSTKVIVNHSQRIYTASWSGSDSTM